MPMELEVKQKLAIQKTGIGIDDKDPDPRSHLNRSRITCREQLVYLHECLSVPDEYFRQQALDDLHMRESDDGKSHEELTFIMGHDHADEEGNPFKKAVRDIERTANAMSEGKT